MTVTRPRPRAQRRLRRRLWSSTSRLGGPTRDAGPSVRTDRTRRRLTELAGATVARDRASDSDREPGRAVVAVPGLVRADDRTVAWAPNVDIEGSRVATRSNAPSAPLPGPTSATTPTARRTPRRSAEPRPTQLALYLTGTVGVGAGIVEPAPSSAGGEGVRRRGRAQPVGDLVVRCGCGRAGCWQASVGLHAMLRAVGDARARHPLGLGRGGGASPDRRAGARRLAAARHRPRARPGGAVSGARPRPRRAGVRLRAARRHWSSARREDARAAPARPDRRRQLRVGALGIEAAALGAAERAFTEVSPRAHFRLGDEMVIRPVACGRPGSHYPAR